MRHVRLNRFELSYAHFEYENDAAWSVQLSAIEVVEYNFILEAPMPHCFQLKLPKWAGKNILFGLETKELALHWIDKINFHRVLSWNSIASKAFDGVRKNTLTTFVPNVSKSIPSARALPALPTDPKELQNKLKLKIANTPSSLKNRSVASNASSNSLGSISATSNPVEEQMTPLIADLELLIPANNRTDEVSKNVESASLDAGPITVSPEAAGSTDSAASVPPTNTMLLDIKKTPATAASSPAKVGFQSPKISRERVKVGIHRNYARQFSTENWHGSHGRDSSYGKTKEYSRDKE